MPTKKSQALPANHNAESEPTSNHAAAVAPLDLKPAPGFASDSTDAVDRTSSPASASVAPVLPVPASTATPFVTAFRSVSHAAKRESSPRHMHRHSVENPSAPWATQQEDLLQHASGEGNRTKARISTGSEAIGNDNNNNKKGDHHTADHEHRRKVEAPGKQRRHARGALVPPNSHRGVIVDEDGRIRLTTLPSSPTVRVRRDPTEQGHGSAHCRTPYGSGGLAVIGVAVSFLVVMGIIFGVVKAVSDSELRRVVTMTAAPSATIAYRNRK